MTLLLVPAVLLVLLGVKQTRPVFAWVWRLLSGSRLDGQKHPNNATWFKRSTNHDVNSNEWHRMPRWQRAAIRTGVTVFILDAATGLMFARRAAELALAVIGAALAAWAGSLAYRKVQRWRPSSK